MVIDTHVLFWWLTDPAALSSNAGRFMENCQAGDRHCVLSGVSLWELELKRRKGRLPLATPVRFLLPKLRQLDFLRMEETGVELWLVAAELDWSHRDPADRVIAATALRLKLPVLTKDGRFHAADSPVEAVW